MLDAGYRGNVILTSEIRYQTSTQHLLSKNRTNNFSVLTKKGAKVPFPVVLLIDLNPLFWA